MFEIMIYFIIMAVVMPVVGAAARAVTASKNNAGSNGSIPDVVNAANEAAQDEAYAAARRRAAQNMQGTAQSGTQKFYDGAASARSMEGKPLVTHGGEDCTGGSIHTERHEGSAAPSGSAAQPNMYTYAGQSSALRGGSAPAQRKPAAAQRRGEGKAGTEGRPQQRTANAGEGRSAVGRGVRDDVSAANAYGIEAAAYANGAERLQKAIADHPAAVQGVIWSEVLSRPLSERE